MQTVKVYGMQDRRSTVQAKLPWVVRYTFDGRYRSKSFRTHAEAERYRGPLLQAVHAGERFDPATGEPEWWQTPLRDVRVLEWSRRLVRRSVAGVATANAGVGDRGTARFVTIEANLVLRV